MLYFLPAIIRLWVPYSVRQAKLVLLSLIRIAVTGFANEPWDSFFDPPLTSVDQHAFDIGTTGRLTFIATD
jgi:DNA-binding LacI/PurR family transcriptional regulator